MVKGIFGSLFVWKYELESSPLNKQDGGPLLNIWGFWEPR
uniref:Uncharacterized protein n=1 Tax=Anguilla anguilla TaxID=7936 RepID=A0A0E9SZ38_ANGAN